MTTSIAPFIHRKVVVLKPDAPAIQAARAMCDNKIGCVVVADDDGRIAGLATDRDLTCNVLAYGYDASVPLLDAMTDDPVVVDENATVQEVVGLMEAHGIRRVPVVHNGESGKQKCVGIVTLDDLISSRSIDYDHLVRVVQSQMFRRRGAAIDELQAERAELRSEAHMEQTLNHFHNVVGSRTGLEGERAARLTRYLLECIIQRMHYTEAAHLIAQLPHKLQDELLDLPAGPNRTISGASILEGTCLRFNVGEATARNTIVQFWAALEELLDRRELAQVKVQLPDDVRALFTGEARPAAA